MYTRWWKENLYTTAVAEDQGYLIYEEAGHGNQNTMHVIMLYKGKSSEWMCPLLAALVRVQLLVLVKMYSQIEELCMH